MYPVFTRKPAGSDVDDPGLCNCYVPCLLSAVSSLCLLDRTNITEKRKENGLFSVSSS